jgi:hypothetical protein
MSGNPTGIRISKHALVLFDEIAAELAVWRRCRR